MPSATGPAESPQLSAVPAVISAPKKRHIRKPGFRPTFPLPLKLRIRSLYLIQQLAPCDVAAAVGLTPKQVSDLANREGWVAIRQRTKSKLLAKHDAQAREEISAIHDAFAVKSEELGMGVLDKAARRMPDEDENVAKDLQALSQTAKNFIGIARQVRGLDLENRDEQSSKSGAVVFVGVLERVAPAPTEKRAESVEVEVSAAAGK